MIRTLEKEFIMSGRIIGVQAVCGSERYPFCLRLVWDSYFLLRLFLRIDILLIKAFLVVPICFKAFLRGSYRPVAVGF